MGGHVLKMVTPVAEWVRSLWPFGQHLIFPERREGIRVLTLKNAARAAIVLVAVFLLLSIWSAVRPAHSGNSLWESRAKPADSGAVSPKSYPVVPEGSIRNYPQEVVIVNDVPTATAQPVAPKKTIEPRAAPQPQPQLGKGKRIVITGGSEGVQVHVEPAPAPAPAPTPPE